MINLTRKSVLLNCLCLVCLCLSQASNAGVRQISELEITKPSLESASRYPSVLILAADAADVAENNDAADVAENSDAADVAENSDAADVAKNSDAADVAKNSDEEPRSGSILLPEDFDKNESEGEDKKCMTVCKRWGEDCVIDPNRGRKCRRTCKQFGQECF